MNRYTAFPSMSNDNGTYPYTLAVLACEKPAGHIHWRSGNTANSSNVPSRASRRDHLVHHHGADIASRTRMIVLRLVLNSRARANTVVPYSNRHSTALR